MMIELSPQQLAQLGAVLQAQKSAIDELMRAIQQQLAPAQPADAASVGQNAQ